METNTSQESFSRLLRLARIKENKTMGQVARELGITVVYYSEVESGKKPSFPEGKVDYNLLAKFLKTSVFQLKRAAEIDREKRQIIKAFGCDESAADLALAFGRRLNKNDLSEKQISKIKRILNEAE